MEKSKKIIISFLTLLCFLFSAEAIDPATVTELVPMGNTTGIKLFFDGVLVVDVEGVETPQGIRNPAQSAGITPGDIIRVLDGRDIHSNEQVREILNSCSGKPLQANIIRNGKEIAVQITPVKGKNGEYKSGMWIRDSMAGIGTITFYDPDSKLYGALGHGICDGDTENLLPFGSGTLMESEVIEVKKGASGKPGELVGKYNLTEDSGTITGNTDAGIFGYLGKNVGAGKSKAIPIGRKEDVHMGKAEILSNVRDDKIEKYSVEISRIFSDKGKDMKNMMIKITDERLISKTGGIVQGMSGSPIIQDGKLVGAVTHVLVNDPTRGYGIFIENMIKEAG